MGLISFLILFPFLAALVMACMRKSGPVRKYTMFVFCVLIMAGTLIFAANEPDERENRVLPSSNARHQYGDAPCGMGFDGFGNLSELSA